MPLYKLHYKSFLKFPEEQVYPKMLYSSLAASTEKFYYDILMRSQYWSADELQAYHRKQLAKVLEHARAYVPFYTNRLDMVFNHDGSINWHRWRDIPIVKRADLVDHHNMMQATKMLPEYGNVVQFSSTGTTGKPVVTTHNRLATWANRAAVVRAFTWHQIDWNKHLCEWLVQDPINAAWPKGRLSGHWGPAWDDYQKGQFWEIDRTTPLKLLLQFLAYRHITYMSLRPKAAQMLAYAAKQFGVKLPLEAILAVGTAVGDDDRKACMEAFGAKIVALYSSKEGHKMAHQCPTGHHFHVNAEVAYLEILNDNNEPCKAGEVGRVIVTPLFSFAQPLIRYEQGDLAEVGGPCACGRTLPVINRIAGRTTHMFRFPNGLKIAPLVPNCYREALNAIAWQIAQTGSSTIEVRYYAEHEATTQSKNYVAEAIPKLMSADVHVKFKHIEGVPLDANNKFLEYVCELPIEEQG